MRRLLPLLALLLLTACGGLTREEAAEALEEAALASEATALTSSSIELYTDFTIGMAVENAAAELQTFVQSQLPCAEITLSGATLTVEYGALPGLCLYRGQTYAGTHTVTVMQNAASQVMVEHAWSEFQNQTVRVSGMATVTWDPAEGTRHVVHATEWTRLSDGRSADGSGDRTFRALPGGIFEGFSLDGTRSWEGTSGAWDLTIEGVEMRWIDPVPQAGVYTLDTPFDATVRVSFVRDTATRIVVTVSNGNRSYDFGVNTL